MTFETLYVRPNGRTSREHFLGAIITVLAAAAFYKFVAKAGLNGEWVMVTLFFPATVLLSRRLHDMGQTAWLLLIPGAIDAAAIGMHWADMKTKQPALALAAVVVSAAFIVWGLVGKGQAESNRFGEAAAA